MSVVRDVRAKTTETTGETTATTTAYQVIE